MALWSSVISHGLSMISSITSRVHSTFLRLSLQVGVPQPRTSRIIHLGYCMVAAHEQQWCSDISSASSIFTCKTQAFWSGADGIRTHALRRAKALRAFRVRPGVSACVTYTSLFPQIEEIGVPAAFAPVLVGLLHGCCTFVQCQIAFCDGGQ